MREAPTRRLTANVPHGFFRRLINRFALGVAAQVATQAHEVAGEVSESSDERPAGGGQARGAKPA